MDDWLVNLEVNIQPMIDFLRAPANYDLYLETMLEELGSKEAVIYAINYYNSNLCRLTDKISYDILEDYSESKILFSSDVRKERTFIENIAELVKDHLTDLYTDGNYEDPTWKNYHNNLSNYKSQIENYICEMIQRLLNYDRAHSIKELIPKLQPIFVQNKIIPLQRYVKQVIYSRPEFVRSQIKSKNWNI